jgi:hypothetical protein
LPRLPPGSLFSSKWLIGLSDCRWEEQVKELATPPSREPLLLKMARVGFPGAERFNIFGDKSQLGNDFYYSVLDPDPRNP